jgi:oligopeptide/dipeptide ABC transporter ATP-binding protein
LSKTILTVENLAVRFETPEGSVPAVRDVSLTLRRGECLALVGESGCGKTLTALSVLRLVPPPGRIAGGVIRVLDRDVASLDGEALRSLRGRDVGMIFQEPLTSLNPVLRVKKHLREALSSHFDLSKDEITRRSVELLREVGIPDPERRISAYPHELSGGLRQRVMIACAIACNPALLIADEPTTALDVTVEAQIMRLLDGLRKTHEMALLLVTHDLGLVAQHADRVSVMYAGYVVEEAGVDELFESPLHPYTRALLAAMPRGTSGEKLQPIPGNVPHPLRAPSGCPFRDRCARAVSLCAQEVPNLEARAEGHRVRCVRVEHA